MSNTVKTFAAILTVSTSFITSIVCAGDMLTIRDIAPDSAMLVVGIDDLRGTMDRLTPTAFGKLWNDAAIA